MIAPLIVLVAHGLDALTLLMATARWGFSGESNPFAQAVFAFGGIGAVLLLKAGGAAILAWIVARVRHGSTEGRFGGVRRYAPHLLLFASAAGILGAAVNLTAVVIT